MKKVDRVSMIFFLQSSLTCDNADDHFVDDVIFEIHPQSFLLR